MALQYGAGGAFTVSMAGPFGGSGGAAVKITEVTILADAWKGGESPYSQVVEVDGVSVNSMVNLHPSVEQLDVFRERDHVFSTENDGGVVTVYAVGDKPTHDYTIQASIMEVVA